MAWIELHQAIWTHRKTLILAADLNLDKTYAAAHMIQLWTWSLDNAPDGNLSGFPSKVIAFGAGWQHEPDLFVEAAIHARFFDRDGDDLYIHDWHDYAGRLLEKRQANALRMRRARAGINNISRATNVQRTLDARAGATVPNHTVPNHTDDDPLQVNNQNHDTTAPHGANPDPGSLSGEQRATILDPDEPPGLNKSRQKAPRQRATTPEPGEQRATTLKERFAQFWAAYPRRKSKGSAEKVWTRLKPNEQLFKTIMDGLERAKTSAGWQKNNGQYIPNPGKWLDDKGWEDEEEVTILEKTGRDIAGDTAGRITSQENRFAGLTRDGGSGEII